MSKGVKTHILLDKKNVNINVFSFIIFYYFYVFCNQSRMVILYRSEVSCICVY